VAISVELIADRKPVFHRARCVHALTQRRAAGSSRGLDCAEEWLSTECYYLQGGQRRIAPSRVIGTDRLCPRSPTSPLDRVAKSHEVSP